MVWRNKEMETNYEETDPPSCRFNSYELTIAGITYKNRKPEMMAEKITL
jgi:hypothetical protein